MNPRMAPLTLAALGLLAGAAQAQSPNSSVSIYGTIDLGIGSLESQPPGPPDRPINTVRGVHNGGVQFSYLGFRGTEDLGGGLKAKFQFESFIRADTGAAGRFNPPGPPQDPFWSRSSWVGLEGGFGELRLGNNSNPAWLAHLATSAMGGNSIFSPSFRQQYNGSTRGYMAQDTALPSSISYLSPRLGNTVVTANLQTSKTSGLSNNVNLSAVHRSGPLVLAVAGASVKHAPSPDPEGALDERFVMVGGAYDFKVVRLFAQYTDHKDGLTNRKTKTPHLGLTVPVGSSQIQLAWAESKVSGATSSQRTTTSAGYLHPLSKRTEVYTMLTNDKLPVVGAAQSYMVGIKHTF